MFHQRQSFTAVLASWDTDTVPAPSSWRHHPSTAQFTHSGTSAVCGGSMGSVERGLGEDARLGKGGPWSWTLLELQTAVFCAYPPKYPIGYFAPYTHFRSSNWSSSAPIHRSIQLDTSPRICTFGGLSGRLEGEFRLQPAGVLFSQFTAAGEFRFKELKRLVFCAAVRID